MPPAPLFLAGLLAGSSVVGLVAFVVAPDPFAPGAAALLGTATALFSMVAAVGALLSRSRWSRWTALSAATVWFGVAVARTTDAWSIVLGLLAMTTAVAAAGPWIERWVRRLPAIEGPPAAAAVALLGLLATPIAAALAAPTHQPSPAAWALSGWSILAAILLGRAVVVVLWMIRLVHVPAAALTALAIGTPAAFALLLPAALLPTVLAWRHDVTLAVRPLVPPPSDAVPIPPELMDPAIMGAVGLDDRGRPLS